MLLQETRLRKQTFERGIQAARLDLPATHPSLTCLPSDARRTRRATPTPTSAPRWLLAVQALPVLLLLLSTVRKI